MGKCIICDEKAKISPDGGRDRTITECNKCGKFYVSGSFVIEPYYKQKSHFYKVSSYIRERNDLFNESPYIDDIFQEILDMRDKKIQEKFDLMMGYFSKLSEGEVLNNKFLAKCWLKDFSELEKLVFEAKDNNFIRVKIGADWILFKTTTFQGLKYIESLEEPNKNSKNIFIAFKFTNELKDIFDNQVKEVVEELGFNYTVVNQETTPHDQKITDEIVAKIKSSRMIIADFTDNSTNVYFEAGFAMGMKIPVIWTCKKGHPFSFDTGQFPHIIWEDADDLKVQLNNRIQAII